MKKLVLLALCLIAVLAVSGCVSCTPVWECSEWSTCKASVQTRTCIDTENCNVTTDKPNETQSCVCVEDWTCTEWSSCSRLKTQSRTCTDRNICGITIDKLDELQACTPPKSIEYTLQLEDFPSGKNWTLKERAERVISDMTSEAKSWGWKEGYYISHMKFEEPQTQWSRVDQRISIYPTENISKVMESIREDVAKRPAWYDLLSNPNIGDESIAYRYTDKAISLGTVYETFYYIITFRKFDVYETLKLYGTVTDYELLKDLAKEAESKIE